MCGGADDGCPGCSRERDGTGRPDEGTHLVAADGLLVEEGGGQLVECLPVRDEQVRGT